MKQPEKKKRHHTAYGRGIQLTTDDFSETMAASRESGVFSGRKNTINPKSYALQKDPSSIKVK